MFEPELLLLTEVSGADQSRVECFRVSNLIPDLINQSRNINGSSGVVRENGMVNENYDRDTFTVSFDSPAIRDALASISTDPQE